MRTLDGPWEGWDALDAGTSATIGVLDGVHRGHSSLLAELDPALVRTVLTFEPHPIEVLRPGTPPRLITTLAERLALFAAAEIDQVGVLNLGEIKDLSPEDFVSRVLIETVNLADLIVGSDFRFGKDRSGDVELLSVLSDKHGFRLKVIDLVEDIDGVLSSSRIRSLVEAGRVGPAAQALGRPFSVTGPVVSGDRRGRELGFPTANLEPPERKVTPGRGVYAGWGLLDGSRHAAAINVGVRPTFGDGALVIEAYLLDFADDIYDEQLTVEFVEHLRPELRFDGMEELVVRIAQDVVDTRAILNVS